MQTPLTMALVPRAGSR